ncbi:MAG TPA: HDOD domain-containing protein [Burkholderiales bacterium]|nr:HDOD domain-containing protein [Burkholderiales bacterium]
MSATDDILDTELPAKPAVLSQLGAEMQKEDPDFARVSDLVNADVGLASAVVKIANSPYIGLGRRIASVHQAVLYLGLGEVFSVVTGLLLRRSFKTNSAEMDRLWDTSSRRAALMSWFAREFRAVSSERAYTCGLFEDCGMGVMLLRAPGYAATMTQLETAANPRELERQQHGLDHVVLSQALVRAWGLPDSIALAVRCHHDVAQLESLAVAPESRTLIALSAIANEAIHRSAHRGPSVWQGCAEQVGRVLGKSIEDIETRMNDAIRLPEAA